MRRREVERDQIRAWRCIKAEVAAKTERWVCYFPRRVPGKVETRTLSQRVEMAIIT